MKFTKIRFEKIGPFENTTLDFSKGSPGLHIVYGANEAGKSSALKYIEWFLFGIDPQNNDDFKYEYKEFLIECTILDLDGKSNLLKRTKTAKNKTLVDMNNTDATPLLATMLGGLASKNFSMQFGISHAQLRSGGRNVLEGKGDLGTMIFEAGAGLGNLLKILKQLEDRAKEIFPSKKSELSATLNAASENYDAIEVAKLSVGTWQNASEQVLKSQINIDELDEKKKLWVLKQIEFERILRALPQLTKYKTAEKALTELDKIPVVEDVTLSKYVDAYNFLTQSNAILGEQQNRVQNIKTKLDKLDPNEKILAVKFDIEALNQSSDLLLKNLGDIGNRQKEKDAKETQIRELLKDYFAETSFDKSRDLFIDQNTQTHIQELSTKINTEIILIESTEKSLNTLIKKIESLKLEEINFAPHASLSEITSLVETIKTKKLAPSDLEKITSDIPSRKLILEGKLNTLANSSITWESFLKLHLPSTADITAFSKLFSENLSHLQSLKTEIKGKKEALKTKHQQLAALHKEGILLTREELTRLRDLRELTWSVIENLLEGKPGILHGDVIAVVGNNSSPKNAFLNIQLQSDQFTDKLFTASDQVGRGNQLTQDMTGLEIEIANLEKTLLETNSAKIAMETDWLNLWADMGVMKINSPEQMLAWQANANTLQQSIIDLVPLLENLATKQKTQVIAFEKLMPLTASTEIEIAWNKAEEIIRNATQFEQLKANNKKQLNILASDQTNLQSDLITQKIKQEENYKIWKGLMVNLKLPANASLNNASKHVTAITNIYQHHKDAKDLETRINKMESDNKEILKKLTKVLEILSIKESPTESADIKKTITNLMRNLSDAIQEEVTQKGLKAELIIANTELEKTKENTTAHKTKLKPLGDIVLENLSNHFEDIRRKNKAKKDYEDAQSALIFEASGKDIPTLAKELDNKNSAIIAGELEEIKSKMTECSEARDKELQEFAHAKANLERLETQAGSHTLSAERELLKSQCSEQVKEFAMLTLAKSLIEDTIKKYRQNNHDPLIIKANTYLKTLTNNSLVELKPNDADGKKSLELSRFESDDKVGINFDAKNINAGEGSTFLSDGTADQLFLALRLAGIETNLEKLKEPMPVILDDILVNFDDDRALSTLRCLAEFSNKTQVILFTHHQHLQKLVSSSDFADKVFMHKLG